LSPALLVAAPPQTLPLIRGTSIHSAPIVIRCEIRHCKRP
jgi:hypothetical protein